MKRWIPISMLALGLFVAGCNNQSTTTGPKGNTATNKKLTLTASKDETVQRGKTETLGVSIKRENFTEPVTVKVAGLPKGVTIDVDESVIATGATSVDLTLKAAPDAVVGEHQATITAEAPGVEKNVQQFKVIVRE